MAKAADSPFDLNAALISAFATNNRINCCLLENVPADAWSAKPSEGKGRTIGAIAAHIQHVRLIRLKAVSVAKLPEKLEESASAKETLKALAESHAALASALSDALKKDHVKSFKPDAASFYTYLIAHDAHHRGQIASLARRLGHPIPQSAGFGMGEWGSRSDSAWGSGGSRSKEV